MPEMVILNMIPRSIYNLGYIHAKTNRRSLVWGIKPLEGVNPIVRVE
jgi:uncharacterized MAPEG superfamily protein